jgi:hypothetical protein
MKRILGRLGRDDAGVEIGLTQRHRIGADEDGFSRRAKLCEPEA